MADIDGAEAVVCWGLVFLCVEGGGYGGWGRGLRLRNRKGRLTSYLWEPRSPYVRGSSMLSIDSIASRQLSRLRLRPKAFPLQLNCGWPVAVKLADSAFGGRAVKFFKWVVSAQSPSKVVSPSIALLSPSEVVFWLGWNGFLIESTLSTAEEADLRTLQLAAELSIIKILSS